MYTVSSLGLISLLISLQAPVMPSFFQLIIREHMGEELGTLSTYVVSNLLPILWEKDTSTCDVGNYEASMRLANII